MLIKPIIVQIFTQLKYIVFYISKALILSDISNILQSNTKGPVLLGIKIKPVKRRECGFSFSRDKVKD